MLARGDTWHKMLIKSSSYSADTLYVVWNTSTRATLWQKRSTLKYRKKKKRKKKEQNERKSIGGPHLSAL